MDRIEEALAPCSAPELIRLCRFWYCHGRPDQRPPRLARNGLPWTVWLVLGGRGAGKTRTGAEWVRGMALGHPDFASRPPAASRSSARPRGCPRRHGRGAVRPPRHPRARRAPGAGRHPCAGWSGRRRRGRAGLLRRGPGGLRGPQFGAAWSDELAKWRHVEATWDMLQFGLRLGARPRQLVTTTPRPIPLMQRLLADPARGGEPRRHAGQRQAISRRRSCDAVIGRYAGTRLGRQELDGEIVEDRPDALWTRDADRGEPPDAAPPLARDRGGGRSAGLVRAAGRRLRDRGGGRRRRRARATCSTTRRCGGARRRRHGRRRRSRSTAGSRRTPSWSRSTRAARWSRASSARSIRACR